MTMTNENITPQPLNETSNTITTTTGEPNDHHYHHHHPINPPLSWEDARNYLLHQVLLKWENEQSQSQLSSSSSSSMSELSTTITTTQSNNKNNNNNNISCPHYYCWDVLLSLILSLSLLILGYFSHQNKNKSSSSPHSYSSSLIAAGIISAISSLLSLLILHHRHRSLLPSHRNAGLKRSVQSYISNLLQMSSASTITTAPPTSKTKITSSTTTTTTTPSSWSGTSLQDIYPVFRRTSSSTSEGEWTRIPTLLMVKGDYVALQVGDTAPALVELVDLMISSSTRSNEDSKRRRRRRRRVMIPGGERVTLDHRDDDDDDDGGDNGDGEGLKLPRGKVRLGSDARELLFLCNGMRVFVLRETPLCGLLRRDHVTHKSPQIHRRGTAIRRLLSIAACLNFAISTAVIFARRPNILSSSSSDNQSVSSLLTMTIPLFSSLCLLPMVTPIILFVLEVLGTSRILTSVHRYTTSSSCCQLHHQQQLRLQKQQQQQQQQQDDGNNNITPYQQPPHLFFSYVLSTFRSRINLPPRNSSSILQPIPPLHLHLLEKLGVTTALALIDDELACEPYSTPERLLIPSGHGLKLLDLCPVVIDDEEDDGDLSSRGEDYEGGGGNGGPPSSPGASSTDSEDRHAAVDHDHGAAGQQQLQQHHHGQQPKKKQKKRLKKLKRRFKRRRSSSENSGGNNTPRKHRTSAETDEDEEEDDEIEEGMVQFEDPQWWHYLPSLKCIGLACLLIDDDNEATAAAGGDVAVAKNSNRNKLENTNINNHSSPKKGGMVNSRSLTSLSTLQQDNDKTNNANNHHHDTIITHKTTTTHNHHHHHIFGLDRSFRRRSDQLSLSTSPPPIPSPTTPPRPPLPHPLSTLLTHITQRPSTHNNHRQLHSLASCIGFTPTDLHPFSIHRRLNLISLPLLHSRLLTSSHALGSEESRHWGTLPVDARSVILNDNRVTPRGAAYQLLTVGDARVVLKMCVDSWQGDVGTMGALSGEERGVVREMEREWRLADLDVRAFSYAPVPYAMEGGVVLLGGGRKNDDVSYLVDNTTPLPSTSTTTTTNNNNNNNNNNTPLIPTITTNNPPPPSPLPLHPDWSLTTNQIFLGLLGSSISPRKFLPHFYSSLSNSGVRFVYFSPRNMRRTKELASQMGIDVAWNCAISLRPLEEGWEEDPHRMTSHYADWDVNAKLPHGVESVKRHLEMVDNVPLLVSLYTDVTEETTVEMVNIFQNYYDTVIALGISHRSRNERTFTTADLSIGVDIHSHQPTPTTTTTASTTPPPLSTEHLLPTELQFVTAIASHSTIFNLPSPSSMSHLPSIIAAGRAALIATLSATHFALHATLSLSLLIGLIPFNPYLSSLHPPPVGCILYLLILTPLLSLTMVTTPPPEDYMTIVPAKNNDESSSDDDDDDDDDGRSRRCYHVSYDRVVGYTLARALPPAVLSHVMYALSFPLLFRGLEDDDVRENVCPMTGDEKGEGGRWLWQCEGLMTYMGPSTNAASVLLVGSLAVTMVVTSMGFLYATKPLRDEPPWKRNKVWLVGGVGGGLVGVVIYLSVTLDAAGGGAVLGALPWYYYLVGLVGMVGCVVVGEVVKGRERVHENRAVRLRRLQFETKLGMWSPK